MPIITHQIVPEPVLREYIDSIWMLQNNTQESKEVVLLPDGRIDLIFSAAKDEPYHVLLMGLGSEPDQAVIRPETIMFAVSFNPIAVEYILQDSVAPLLNSAYRLPDNFWGLNKEMLNDFDLFVKTISDIIKRLASGQLPDSRKQELFRLIYASKGSATVQDLSDQVAWSSRQINRYFTQQFGLSLKSYCEIIRFRASFHDLKQGKLFPEENFADQSHFIKQVKKLSGVSPKKLAQNQDDRFVQFSALKSK